MDWNLRKVELHCHTVASIDGLISYQSLLRTARAIGLDAIAVTDHDTVQGALAARELARRSDSETRLEIIVGEERTLDDGSHLIGLFLQEAIRARSLPEVLQEVDGQGGLCLIPHPFRKKDGLLRNGLEPLRHFEGRTGGFEYFSAKCSYEENRRAADLLRGTHLGPFVGSDAHYECDLGESINEISISGTADVSNDWRTGVREFLARKAPCRLLGKSQAVTEGERAYAPLYYRVRKHVRLPRVLLPWAKQSYRRYRNWRFGVGRKQLREVYRHA